MNKIPAKKPRKKSDPMNINKMKKIYVGMALALGDGA